MMEHANTLQTGQGCVIPKLFYIQSKEIGNKKCYEETRIKKCQSEVSIRLNIDIRKEKEDSLLNVKEKGRLNFSRKSKTASNFHLVESLLENWLKNNYITVDIYYLRSLLHCIWGILRVSKLLNRVNLRRSK